jgi:hypothetical protein
MALGEPLQKAAAEHASSGDFTTLGRETIQKVNQYLQNQKEDIEPARLEDLRGAKHIWLTGLWYGRIFVDVDTRRDLAAAAADATAAEKWLNKVVDSWTSHLTPEELKKAHPVVLPKFAAPKRPRAADLDAAWQFYYTKTAEPIFDLVDFDWEDEVAYRKIFDVARFAAYAQLSHSQSEMEKVVADIEKAMAHSDLEKSGAWREPLAAAKTHAQKGLVAKGEFEAEMRKLIRGLSTYLDNEENRLDRSPRVEGISFTSSGKTVDLMPPLGDEPARPTGFPPGTIVNPEPSAVIKPGPVQKPRVRE